MDFRDHLYDLINRVENEEESKAAFQLIHRIAILMASLLIGKKALFYFGQVCVKDIFMDSELYIKAYLLKLSSGKT